MGIQDFYKVLEEHCPDVMVNMKLSALSGIKIAVDISIFLNKFVKTAGEVKWIESFIILLCTLKRNGIKPVCIFDGPSPPKEKSLEQDRRRAQAAKTKERIEFGKKLVKRLEVYKDNEKHLDDNIINEVKSVIGIQRGRGVNVVNYDDVYDVLAVLKDSIAKKERQNLPILPIYSQKAKEIIDIMGFSYFQAEGEAETLCASLCFHEIVDAVLSEDTDVLAYGTPFMLSKIDFTNETVTAISYNEILNSLNFTKEEFTDLCILLSCDYNDRVKGFAPDGKKRKKPAPIGAKGAFAMIKEYRRLEEAEKHMVDPDPLNYRRCRELFTPIGDLSHINVPFNKPINKEVLVDFIQNNSVKLNINYILDTWKPCNIKFIDDDDESIEED